ncbi:MAG: hydantoinase/oxoprolinase family protein [Pseudomonadota bacterium]
MTKPALLLGIDTGGTYTDAVLWDADASRVVAKAKALTTHYALDRGVAAAIDRVLREAAARPAAIGLVSLSTTLATNALVEGQGAPAALIMIGFEERDLARAGLKEAVAGDPFLTLPGGHDSHGTARAPLDLEQLEARASTLADEVTAFAVAAQFATRNPSHEIAARDCLRAATGLPVSCSHELTARLGGPRRALTAFLNARLIGLLARLIDGAEALMAARDIAAPLMVVRGDGALMSAATARERPIETILSGPAASLVGAATLTRRADIVVSDIGGTTTDIAVLEDGRPRRDPEGAIVGGWRTLVEAAAIRTFGLGADSIVDLDPTTDKLILGPRRATPIALLATEHADLVNATLDRQSKALRAEESHGRFVHLARGTTGERPATGAEASIIERLAEGPAPLDLIATNRTARSALDRLSARGLIRLAAFTPSDAAHVLGRHTAWNTEAALAAATLFAARKTRFGSPVAEDAQALAKAVIARMTRRSAECLVEALAEDAGLPAPDIVQNPAIARALDRQTGASAPTPLEPAIRLALPLAGLGASAPVYYPALAEALGTEAVIPKDADVANAVGAVAGLVETRLEVTILQPQDGVFTAGLDGTIRSFGNAGDATAAVEAWLRENALSAALAAGAAEPAVRLTTEDRTATIEVTVVLIERRITATASGRPAVSKDMSESAF